MTPPVWRAGPVERPAGPARHDIDHTVPRAEGPTYVEACIRRIVASSPPAQPFDDFAPMTIAATPTSRVHVRVRPWRGDPATAECLATPIGSIVSPAMVSDALERATADGFERAVTPAMPPYEWRPYIDAGFTIREHLHLLGHDLITMPERPPADLHRARRRDMDAIIEVDHAAFGSFWRLDIPSLREAARATAVARLRVATLDGDVVGYSLYGRSGDRGYLQRLAVHPDGTGAGLGSALVVDGLRWLRRHRARDVLVNTQETNERALTLYERLGFRPRPGGLAVLEATLATGVGRAGVAGSE